MSKSHIIYRCHSCDRVFTQFEATYSDNHDVALCPICQRILRVDADLSANPIGLDFGLRLLGALARVIINAGIIETLQKKAAESETKLDDAACRTAAVILQELAKL